MAEAPLYIGPKEAENNLVYEELIPELEKALGEFSRRDGGVIQPVRTCMEVDRGFVFVMPGYGRELKMVATKIVTFFPGNEERTGFPSHQSTAFIHDSETGCIKAILDAESITNKRTAAASAIATTYLAPENAKIYAVIGAGSQGESHLQALMYTCKFEEVRIWNRTFEKAEALAKKYGCVACRTLEEAVRDADVISTCTSSQTPVLDYKLVKAGAHINCVGACVPQYQELDPLLMQNAVVYVDSVEGALKESGDIIKSKVEIYAEIGEVIIGQKEAKRNQLTIFKNLGMAIEDVLSCKLIYENHFKKVEAEKTGQSK